MVEGAEVLVDEGEGELAVGVRGRDAGPGRVCHHEVLGQLTDGGRGVDRGHEVGVDLAR